MAATLHRRERQAEEEGPWADVMGPGARPVLVRVPCPRKAFPGGAAGKRTGFPAPEQRGREHVGQGSSIN